MIRTMETSLSRLIRTPRLRTRPKIISQSWSKSKAISHLKSSMSLSKSLIRRKKTCKSVPSPNPESRSYPNDARTRIKEPSGV